MSDHDAETLNEWAAAFASLLIDRWPGEDTEDLLALAWLEGWRKACESLVPAAARLDVHE